MAYTNNIKNGCINVRDYGLTGRADALISQSILNTIFDACVAHNRPVFFPDGTYVFPENFTYNFGLSPVHIIGESRDRTIITTKYGSVNHQIVERIDLTKPRTQGDGFYRIDKIGVNHSDWGTLSNPDIDDYIKISSGVPSIATFSEVKAANYITELDVTLADPGVDGLYVVATIDESVSGGGYTHSNLPYNTSVKIVTGTVLKRASGVWSRLVPGRGFEFGGNFRIENMQFNNVAFYLFTPNNTTVPDFEYYSIVNCRFRHVARVNSLDRQFASTSIQNQGFMKGLNHHFRDGERFNYQKVEFLNNEFSYIHTCILWECPPTKKLEVIGNSITDCFTHTEMFIYLPMSSVTSTDAEDDEGYTNKTQTIYRDNLFMNVRHYSPMSFGGHHIMRANGKAIFDNNKIYDCTGTMFYLSGNDNVVTRNRIVPFMQNYPTKEGMTWGAPAIFHIKTGNQIELLSTIIADNKVERSAMITPFDIKNTDTNLIITGNKVLTMGYAEALLSTDFDMNRELLYTLKDVEKFKSLALGGSVPAFGPGVYVSGSYVLHNDFLYCCVTKTSDVEGTPDVNSTKWRLINKDKYVYWDIRRSKWMFWPASMNRQMAILEKNYDSICSRTINFSNNIMYGYCLVRCIDGFIKELTLNDNEIYVERDLLYHSVGGATAEAYNGTLFQISGNGSYIETMRLYNNRIYRGNALITTKYYNSIFNLHASNNEFYYGIIGYDIVFKNECNWINNHVRPWPRYNDTSLVSLLPLPNSSTVTPIRFRKVMPANWSAKAYAVGSYVTYGSVQYVAVEPILSSDANPAMEVTKWNDVNVHTQDNATLNIQGGSFDSSLARYGCVSFENIRRVFIKDTYFKATLINDWASMFRPSSSGGQSRRYVIVQNTASTIDTLEITDIKTDFDARDNRYLLYSNAANTISNLRVNSVLPVSDYSVNKMYYQDSSGSLVVSNSNLSGIEYLETDTVYEGCVTNKEFSNRQVLNVTADTSVVIPKGTFVDMVIVETSLPLSFKIGTTSGGSELASEAINADANIFNIGMYAASQTTMYFSGITGGTSVKIQIFKR